MEMARSIQASTLVWVLAAVLVSQNLVVTVKSTSVEDQKNFFSPDPHAGTGSTPAGSHGSLNCLTPPHDPHTPSSPSHFPSPSTPSYTPTPSAPSHNPTPHNPTPSAPSHNPTPHNPTPSTPSGGVHYHSPPTTPAMPHTPSAPTPPLFDPNTPFHGTCNYWRNHPTIIWGVVGWWGTMGSSFGGHSVPGLPSSLTLPQALSNTRTDGLGALYREGTASLLNSMVSNEFPFTTKQVRDSFVAALGSETTAAAQASVFKLANEGHLKPRA